MRDILVACGVWLSASTTNPFVEAFPILLSIQPNGTLLSIQENPTLVSDQPNPVLVSIQD